MKKFLLGTTALVGAVALVGSAHAAGGSSGPSVTVGGNIDFQAAITDQDADAEVAGTGATRDTHFVNDTEIHVNVEGKADNGITYGAVIELNADVDDDAEGDGGNADKTYIFLESSAGRVELGNNVGAQATLKVDASSIARATGGIDGDWHHFVDVNGVAANKTVSSSGRFITTPDLPSDHGEVDGSTVKGEDEDSTKITYYTPRFSGFQGGVSFTPDEGDTGTATSLSGEDGTDQETVWGLGVNYEGNYSNVGIQASVTAQVGEAEQATTEDLSAWAVGLGLNYQGFSLAGSWADWSDTGLATTGVTNDDQNFWTLGAAYETGPFGVSVTYMDSEATDGTNEDSFNNLVIGADYQLAPGLLPYVEVSFFDLDEGGVTTDNDGSVVLIGANLSF